MLIKLFTYLNDNNLLKLGTLYYMLLVLFICITDARHLGVMVVDISTATGILIEGKLKYQNSHFLSSSS